MAAIQQVGEPRALRHGDHQPAGITPIRFEAAEGVVCLVDLLVREIPSPFSGDDFEVNDGLFSTAYAYALNGDPAPDLQNTTVHVGTWAARLGNDTFGVYTGSIVLGIWVEQASDLGFWYVNPSPNARTLLFRLDSTVLLEVDTQSVWTQFSTPVNPGLHVIEWRVPNEYADDFVFIDDITLTPN